MAVYEITELGIADGGYTETANELDRQFRAATKDIIRKAVREKIPVEYITYIAQQAIHMELLRQQIEFRRELNNELILKQYSK